MEVTVTEKDNWQRTVEVLVPRAELEPEIEKGLKKYQKNVKLQGFRKGRVPLSLIRRMYGPKIEYEVIEDILPSIVTRAWKQENLRVVSTPKVEDLHFQPGESLRLTFTVDVEPEVEVEKFENFKFVRRIFEVSKEDVESMLEGLRYDHAVWETVDGEAQEDHFVVIEAQELDDTGVPVIGRKIEEMMIPLKDVDGKLTKLGEQLLGVKAGEKRVVKLTPDEQHDKLAQSISYEVTVKEVKQRILPDLDDEFAKDVSEYDTLEQLKAHLEEQIRKYYQNMLDTELETQIIDEIVKNNPFDLPESMIESSMQAQIEHLKSQLKEGETFDEEAVRKEYRPTVIRNVKWALIARKLIDKFHITVSEEEIRAAAQAYAEKHEADPERFWNRIKNDEESINKFREDILGRKLLETLKTKQKIKEKKTNRKELEKKRIITV